MGFPIKELISALNGANQWSWNKPTCCTFNDIFIEVAPVEETGQ